MSEVKYLINRKSKYFKVDKNLQKYINSGLKKIYLTIKQFEDSGTPFEKIFNCESLIYDRIGTYFTYKFHAADNTQLRILYTYSNVDNEPILKLIHFKVKRRNDKDYIKFFEDYISTFDEKSADYQEIEL